MSEEGFLARWARRKAEARRTVFAEPTGSAADPLTPTSSPPEGGEGSSYHAASPRPRNGGEGQGEGDGGAGTIATTDPIDLSTLPDLATLGADSDFTPFLRPGVPAGLRTAALRKLWTSDPAILNYKTLADYDWDFNAPGYGSLLPIDDVKRLVDLAIGELRRTETHVEAVPTPEGTAAPAPAEAEAPPAVTMADAVVVPVASAIPTPSETPPPPRKRRHGGAVPD